MTLPNADLQFTIRIKKAGFDKATKDIALFKKELNNLFAQNNRLAGRGSFRRSRKNVNQEFKKMEDKIKKKLMSLNDGSEFAMEAVLNQIKNRAVFMTPRDTGLLRETAFVVTHVTKTTVQGRVGYNITSGQVPEGVKTGADYAVFVHEMIGYHHNVGQAKFLQIAVEEIYLDIPRRISSYLQDVTKGMLI